MRHDTFKKEGVVGVYKKKNKNNTDVNVDNEMLDDDDGTEMINNLNNPNNADIVSLLPLQSQKIVGTNNNNTTRQKQQISSSNNNKNNSINRNKKRNILYKRKQQYYYDDNFSLLKSQFDNDNDNYNNNNTTSTSIEETILKPLWLGIGLFLILLSFWILDVLKDPVLGSLVHNNLELHLPQAKLFSVCFTFLLVISLEYISYEQQQQNQQQQQFDTNDIDTNTTGQQQLLQQNQVLSEDDDDDLDVQKLQQRIDLKVHQQSTYNKERPVMDILHDRGNWSKMETTSSSDYLYHDSDPLKPPYPEKTKSHHQSKSQQTQQTQQTQQQQQQKRVPSTIFVTIGVPYCIALAIVAYFLQFNESVVRSSESETKAIDVVVVYEPRNYWIVLGYIWYCVVESYGSIAVATFWSYTNSTLSLHDAERYYGSIISIAQLGAIIGTTLVTTHIYSTSTLIVLACLIILLHIIVMILYNTKYHPSNESSTDSYGEGNKPSTSYWSKSDTGTNTTKRSSTIQLNEGTVWVGIHSIVKYNYVLLILGVSCLYEVSLTILNYQMTLLGWQRYDKDNVNGTEQTFTQFMGRYGQMVNIGSLIMSSILFPFLLKQYGVRRTLWIFPSLLLIANLLAFGAIPGNLNVLLIAMALLKAMTYSIHDPTKELLYMPTSNIIKFQSKFWIDIVGARFAKAFGSMINAHSGSVQRSVQIASIPSITTAFGLLYVCYKVGIQFEQLIASNTIVGESTRNPSDDVIKYDSVQVNDLDSNDETEIIFNSDKDSMNTTNSLYDKDRVLLSI